MTTPVRSQDNSFPRKNDTSKKVDEERAFSSLTDEQGDPARDTAETDDKKKPYVYRDYSRIRPPPDFVLVARRMVLQQQDPVAVRSLKLPAKLEAMLSIPEFQHIISWLPHGRAWKIHDAAMFLQHVMPRFFEYNNYNSFVRLVNAWGFRRLTKGPDRSSYWHEVRTSLFAPYRYYIDFAL